MTPRIVYSCEQYGYQYFSAGALSKVLASVITYPYQVLKSRLQAHPADLNYQPYKGFVDVVICTWRYDTAVHMRNVTAKRSVLRSLINPQRGRAERVLSRHGGKFNEGHAVFRHHILCVRDAANIAGGIRSNMRRVI